MPTVDGPLIVQGDLTILLEVAAARAREARDSLAAFAELVKSPEHVHTFRITPLSIWNACAVGMSAEEIIAALEAHSRYALPGNVLAEIRELAARFGRLVLRREGEELELRCEGTALADDLAADPNLAELLERTGPETFRVALEFRGTLKQRLIKEGLPVRDLAGFTPGEALALELRTTTASGAPLALRRYQAAAADAFHAGGRAEGGSGVVVLPCGAGKTIVGMASMAKLATSTLVLTTSTTAVRQWIDELLDKTTLTADEIGEYSGARKEIRPVTVATYQVLTHRASVDDAFTHLGLFDSREWGLIVYDEVHLLPAPVFQVTASLQARRRLGLTATLIREDGLERDVFALIGPKCWDMPWKELEADGWIAKARCCEIRLGLPAHLRGDYAAANERAKLRVAAENPDKLPLVRALLERHAGEAARVIGTFVDQLSALAEARELPLITGATPQRRREELYAEFRAGALPALVVSKVANFAIDLPDASVAIQVSGTFGSRQEEAQRLGRLLRPKPGANQAHFYSLVTRETKEAEYAMKRQLFLCEQGYEYAIYQDPSELPEC
jgi:DNA excision repair protein ERCC-3